MRGSESWQLKITQFHSDFAAEETDQPKVTQQLGGTAVNRLQTLSLPSLLLVYNVITSLVTLRPSSLLCLRRGGLNISLVIL